MTSRCVISGDTCGYVNSNFFAARRKGFSVFFTKVLDASNDEFQHSSFGGLVVQRPEVLETQIKFVDEVVTTPLLPKKLNIFASQLKTFVTGAIQRKRLVFVSLAILLGWTDVVRGRTGRDCWRGIK